MSRRRILVGMSGASGVILAVRLMEELRRDASNEVHLIASPAARRTLELELPARPWAEIRELAHRVHEYRDIAAAPASGSFRHAGMALIPCSINTASAVSLGLGSNLLARAADVTLKERRVLVVVPREVPLHQGHLESLARLAALGARIVPPMLTFYHHPESVSDLIDHVVGKVLDQLGLEHGLVDEWDTPGDPGPC